MMRVAAFFAAAIVLASAPAGAADNADPFDTYETTLSGGDAAPSSRVAFDGKDCGGECYAASLDCLAEGGIGFQFGDVAAKIAAGAITREARDFALDAGGTAFAFLITGLRYGGDMNGTWVVDGELPDSAARAALVAALGKAKTFKATIGGETLTLPVTADVKTWAAACKQ